MQILEPTGFIGEDDPAEWRMRFIWPFKAEYLVAYLDDQSSETIVARSKRDYVWIMTRAPEIDEAAYAALLSRVEPLGAYRALANSRSTHQIAWGCVAPRPR